MSLRIQSLTLVRGKHRVLHGFEGELHEGEHAMILGANGSGKSTLLEAVAGLLSPREGTVELQGQSVRTQRPSISYLPQVPRLLGHLSVEEQVVYHLGLVGQSLATSERLEVLDAWGIRHLRKRPCRKLSGGQAQRVALAMALGRGADLYLLDEPSNHLDEEGLSRLRSQLKAVSANLLVASHDPTLLEAAKTWRLDA